MERITALCVEKEIKSLLEHGAFSYDNLERLNILCKSMKNLSQIRHEFTEEDANEWVKNMNPPARWTKEQTSALMKQRNYDHEPTEFFAVMNALASDYGKTLAKYNVDIPELWAELAHDFICDADAAQDKVGKYWRDVVKHE